MDTNLLITILTSFVTICTTIITVRAGNDKVQNTLTRELEKHNAVQDERISNLTKQVQKDFRELMNNKQYSVYPLDREPDVVVFSDDEDD